MESFGPYDNPDATLDNGDRVYHNFCMDCCEHYDCEYNYVEHRKIVHSDWSGISNTLALVNTKGRKCK